MRAIFKIIFWDEGSTFTHDWPGLPATTIRKCWTYMTHEAFLCYCSNSCCPFTLLCSCCTISFLVLISGYIAAEAVCATRYLLAVAQSLLQMVMYVSAFFLVTTVLHLQLIIIQYFIPLTKYDPKYHLLLSARKERGAV